MATESDEPEVNQAPADTTIIVPVTVTVQFTTMEMKSQRRDGVSRSV